MNGALEWVAGRGGRKAFFNSLVLFLAVSLLLSVFGLKTYAQQQTRTGPVGVEGVIPTDPPKDAPIITVPSTGNNFTRVPITVAGLCTKGLLVELFKNGVFSGAVNCTSGSFSLQVDLFDGRNDLIARHYDTLNQAGPDSNIVTVNFTDTFQRTGPRISITSNYAKRGADPNTTLTWPIIISGGTGPFAISVDWGDKTPPDLISRSDGGDMNIEHSYAQAGVYNIIIKATDTNGESAFLQVVGIGNGPTQQSVTPQQSTTKVIKQIIWWPFLILLILIIIAFWLGGRHKLSIIRERLRRGERPFK